MRRSLSETYINAQLLVKNMKKECEFIINKIYPDDWEKYNEKEQEKKEKEFDVALFF